jgi:hypothetical protein
MKEERIFIIVLKSLFLKSAILSIAVLGIVLAKPVTGTVVSGAHQICQFTMQSVERCEAVC